MSSYLPMWMASSFYLESGPGMPGLGTTGYPAQLGRIYYIAPPSWPNDFKMSTRPTSIFTIVFFWSRKARRGGKTYKNDFHIFGIHFCLRTGEMEKGEGRKGKTVLLISLLKGFIVCFCLKERYLS